MDKQHVHGDLVVALERRGKTREAGDLLEFCCPRHEDTNPSAWLGEHRWGCHACGFEERLGTLCTELGIDPPKYGFTVEDYAQLKGFELSKLCKWGVETGRTMKWPDNDLVAIPYRDANGETIRIKFRKATGTFWDPDHGNGAYLYGLDMLAKTPNDMPVVLVEGESDCHAAWSHQRLAIGVPGANGWKSVWRSLLVNREVYVWQEPGKPAEKFAADICRDLPHAKVIRVNGTKDLADLHRKVGEDFGAELDRLIADAEPPDFTTPIEEDVSVVNIMDAIVGKTIGRLHGAPSNPELEAALTAFAKAAVQLNPLQRKLARVGAIRGLDDMKVKGSAGLVDAALESTRSTADGADGKVGSQILLADVEPAEDPVDGFEMLNAITAKILCYMAMPFDLALTAALWAIFTHLHDTFWISPILAITSPEKRCGKTQLLTLLQGLTTRPLPSANLTPASLFRVVEVFKPTLLIDEADTFIRKDDDGLRGILNSGHLRASAQIVRTVGEDHEPRLFSTWAPKAIACIRQLPDTLEDRSIILRLRRRAPGDTITDFPSDRIHGELEPLRRQIARWALDNKEGLRYPDVPDGLNDRARDNWKPLLAIADLIGQGTGALARKAALTFSGGTSEERPNSELLLGDIRDLFDSKHTDRLKSEDIIEALVVMEEKPWPEWGRTKRPMTKVAMARQLKRFGIKPKMIRIGDKTVRGYDRKWFEDAFARYIPC